MKLEDLFDVMDYDARVMVECYDAHGDVAEQHFGEACYMRADCADILDCPVCGLFIDGDRFLVHVDL